MKSYLTNISHSVGKEMAGSSYTLNCCLSNFGSILEAGTKQSEVWLQYLCSMVDGPPYSSFGVSVVLFWWQFGDLEDSRYIHGCFTYFPWWSDESLTLFSRRCNGDIAEMCASINVCKMSMKCFS